MAGFDAIIIGARCGGAPIALELAKAGHKVLLLDRMKFGSDIMSTHFVKRGGISLLKKWGLLEDVKKAGTPAIKTLTFDVDGTKLTGQAMPFGDTDEDYTPRRIYLDKIIVDAAIKVGAEAREGFKVTELIFENDRVVGVKGIHSQGTSVSEYAKVVIGADGINSFVAKATKAEKRVNAGTHTCGYYAYYSGTRVSVDSANLYIRNNDRRFLINFPTNDGLDMVFLFWPTEEAKRVRGDIDAAFNESLKLAPDFEERVHSGTRETKFYGSHLFPNYMRRAHGAGWALVGDAAIHRCPITAQGITNAFTHADILSEELKLAFSGEKEIDQALSDYDNCQFNILKPMFDYTLHLALLQPLHQDIAKMLPMVKDDPVATSAFLGAFMGSVPLDKVLPPHLIETFANDVQQNHDRITGLAVVPQ